MLPCLLTLMSPCLWSAPSCGCSTLGSTVAEVPLTRPSAVASLSRMLSCLFVRHPLPSAPAKQAVAWIRGEGRCLMVILQVGFCYALHVGTVVWAAVAAAVAVPLGGWVASYSLVPWYGHTYVRYVRTYTYVRKMLCHNMQRTMVRNTYVHVYVLIMLCHHFLIGKGHTCALSTRVPMVQVYLL